MKESIKNIFRPIYWVFYAFWHNLKSESPVFIVGCAHSGTTLILRILYEHKDLYAVDYESSVIGANYINYPMLAEWTKTARNTKKSAWVEKTPDQIRYLGKIFSVFPKAKVIVMLRDGRDVALSLKNRSGNLDDHMERWVHDNKLWLQYENDARVISIKLEDFVNDSKLSLAKICDHIGVDYNDKLLEYHNKDFKYSGTDAKKTDGKGENHQHNRNWQVNQKIFKSTSRWMTEASADDMASFEQSPIFKELLNKFNYLNDK
jgi:hypothetical protein